MCRKPDPKKTWRWGWGYTEEKKNVPETMAYPVMWRWCECGRTIICFREGGTMVEAEEI